MAVQRRTFDARPDSVAAARHAAVDWARDHGADERTQQSIALAVSEAASNVVVHAYRGDEAGQLILELAEQGSELCVTVSDRGGGIAPRPDSPGLGLGMPLIANLAEHLEVRTLESGGTEVRMRFRARAACGA